MEQAKDIKLVILDVDGVLTDGRIVVDDNGVESRGFDIKDGLGIVALQMSGVEVAIITSKRSAAVRHRAEDLKIKRVFDGVRRKTEPYEQILAQAALTAGQVCYVGDDLVDLAVMKRVGFPVAVADAAKEVREAARYVTRAPGGRGAIRELAELILKTQGKWEAVLAAMA